MMYNYDNEVKRREAFIQDLKTQIRDFKQNGLYMDADDLKSVVEIESKLLNDLYKLR